MRVQALQSGLIRNDGVEWGRKYLELEGNFMMPRSKVRAR